MLVKIQKPEFDIELEIAYATSDNITGKPIYKKAECYLHIEAAELLQKAINYAAGLGYRIKIFDGYRPTEAQFVLWEDNPDPKFLSNPYTGSPHSRGVAVDLTLIDADGNELDMGTGFDDFTSKSYHSNTEISAQAQQNRRILLGVMTAADWDWYDNEWWHYQLFNPRAYPLLSDSESGANLM